MSGPSAALVFYSALYDIFGFCCRDLTMLHLSPYVICLFGQHFHAHHAGAGAAACNHV